MEQLAKSLYEASKEGNVARLNDLTEQDELILERCSTMTSYGDTPLHIVAMIGHLDFCMELVRRSPGLVLQLDSRRSSALHLASFRGHTDIVKALVSAQPEMCLAYDGDGYNPVYLAAMKGRVEVLKELVNVCPDAVFARVKTSQGGNVLHLCVNYYQTEALKFLVELPNGNQLLNSIDSYGNSILHLAAGAKLVEFGCPFHLTLQIIEYLVSQTSIELNTQNSNGLTASDVLKLQPQRDSKYIEIAHLLLLSSGQTLSSLSCGHLSEMNSQRGQEEHVRLDKQRNSLMVVASLMATMAFQAGVNPPTGFEPDSLPYKSFVVSNTIGFLSSLSVILLLISGLPLRHKVFTGTWTAIMWISISATITTYIISLEIMSNGTAAVSIVISVWFDLMGLLLLVHSIRFLSRRTQDWPFKCKCFMWIFIVIVWIIALLQWTLTLKMYKYYPSVSFGLFITGWMAASAVLIVLYAIQLVFFITKKSKKVFKEFNLNMFSNNQASHV